MDELICIESLNALPRLASQLSALDVDEVEQTAPDAHWILVRKGQELVGRCSLWWRDTPPYPKQQLGLIGHYAAQDRTAAETILAHACQQLALQGKTLAIAPINGSTWRPYRLVIESSDTPPFFLEPNNPEHCLQIFLAAGFTPFARYSSALCSCLDHREPRLERAYHRLEQLGVRFRSVNLQQPEHELRRIYAIAAHSFRRNFLYQPISETAFIAQYQQLIPYIHPELVFIAEHHQKPVGFLLAFPDWLTRRQDASIDRFVIKTVAVLPQSKYAGLGNVLVEHCHAIAHQLGYRQAIHALMHDANPSRNLSHRYARTIRRYALLAKPL
ncbi:MAG: GNAT family N-acetyltransferase [Leptolyngbyaceae cyanobacterium MO_188.B28]|nr:GNAT family N-acetyltransferase [Leptolyngbyaceae cyanobacterium MO_188.B28]